MTDTTYSRRDLFKLAGIGTLGVAALASGANLATPEAAEAATIKKAGYYANHYGLKGSVSKKKRTMTFKKGRMQYWKNSLAYEKALKKQKRKFNISKNCKFYDGFYEIHDEGILYPYTRQPLSKTEGYTFLAEALKGREDFYFRVKGKKVVEIFLDVDYTTRFGGGED